VLAAAKLAAISVSYIWCVSFFPKDLLQGRRQIIFEIRVRHWRILTPFPIGL